MAVVVGVGAATVAVKVAVGLAVGLLVGGSLVGVIIVGVGVSIVAVAVGLSVGFVVKLGPVSRSSAHRSALDMATVRYGGMDAEAMRSNPDGLNLVPSAST